MTDQPLFSISLAQWSLHRAIRSGELDPLDFPNLTRDEFGIGAVEYVNTLIKDLVATEAGLEALSRRTREVGVRNLLIMVDGEGDIGHPDTKERDKTIVQHHWWLAMAAHLGCHSIRVNARSEGSPEQQHQLVADGLNQLCELADSYDINVLVENHGGLSSNGAWLASVMEAVDHSRCGTLPDFGNFYLKPGMPDVSDMVTNWYDRYRGVAELMPWAKAVSAKSNVFDEQGNETETDYHKMVQIVLDAGYRGYLGIEYEGTQLSEHEGIHRTKALLERVRNELE